MNIYIRKWIGTAVLVCLLPTALTACNQKKGSEETTAPQTTEETVTEPETAYITPLTPDGLIFPDIGAVPEPEEEPAPEYLRIGVEHSKIGELQGRLMELGFMDNDEPTHYFGSVTESAVVTFQRQVKLPQDGIVGPATWEAIMSPEAKYYTVATGDVGEDIKRIQTRLYELGYLAGADLVTGQFGDVTEAAVKRLQELNGISTDGKVGHQTVNLLYSDEIKPNFLSYGEKSDVVLEAQKRLKELGYLTTTPDGAYGNDTVLAVKQFQARNDQVVDGYLGPSTRVSLNDSAAQPNGLTLGETSESVQRIQQLLANLGYLSSANVTGYYGELTEKAVKSFQTANGLTADGSVGRMTMNKLTGTDAKKAGSGSSGSGGTGNSSGVSKLISVAQSKLGRPYVWGAKGPNSFDCSGFVYWCLNQAGVRQSYLTSAGWRSVGKYTKITSFSNIRAGDIVVVKGHMGIAAGNGQVIDASSSNGKVVQRSLSSWWARNFICAWRIF